MSLRADIEKILAAANMCDVDPDRIMDDEHARYEVYVNALSLVSSSGERELISVILRDPDHVMSEAALVNHIDRQASVLNSCSSYDGWVSRIVDLISRHGFLVSRIKEWRIFKEVIDGGIGNVDELCDASDWLQRKVAHEATSRAVLETLARVGRTKRVRNIASSRSKNSREE
ncbi:MAG: hypothetical protein ACRDRX_05765 [Pseudonocardiaceae bacterium]